MGNAIWEDSLFLRQPSGGGGAMSYRTSHHLNISSCLTTHLTISSCLTTHHLVSFHSHPLPDQQIKSNFSHNSIYLMFHHSTITLPQESGRLQYFGFSSMDCGIVIRDIGTRDSGGWTCRVSATVAGKHQVSADIVRLFVGENSFSL